MGKIIYRIIPQPNSTFNVEIFRPGKGGYGASGFQSEAAAEAWINEKKKTAKADKADDVWERISHDASFINGRQQT
jgi:hypothetical protein